MPGAPWPPRFRNRSHIRCSRNLRRRRPPPRSNTAERTPPPPTSCPEPAAPGQPAPGQTVRERRKISAATIRVMPDLHLCQKTPDQHNCQTYATHGKYLPPRSTRSSPRRRTWPFPPCSLPSSWSEEISPARETFAPPRWPPATPDAASSRHKQACPPDPSREGRARDLRAPIRSRSRHPSDLHPSKRML